MPVVKAHRIGRACENCNKRKIRCKPQIGTEVCEACSENGNECVARMRKKRKRSTTRSSSTRAIGLTQPDDFLGRPSDTPQDPEALLPGLTNESNLFHLIPAECQIPRSIHTRSNSMKEGHGWYEETISRLTSNSQDTQSYVSSPHAERPGSEEIPQLIAHDNGVDPTARLEYDGGLVDIDYQILQLRNAFQLPPRSIRESLNDAFMERCYPWTPIIKRNWLCERSNTRTSLLLIQSVFLAASRVSSSPTVAAYATPHEFYQRAKTLFWTGHEQDALMTIRAACILNWYIPHGPEQVSFDTSKFWIHIAVGLAHQIGLHKEPPVTKARIMRRRLWWSLVVRDSLLSASHGKPRAINLDDCEVERPCLQDFPDSLLEGHLFIHYVDVCSALGDITECYARKYMSRAHKLHLQNSMSQWTKDLPNDLRLFQKSAHSIDCHVSRYNFNARQLHVPYFVVLAIMHKAIAPNNRPSAISVLAASYIAGIYEDFLARDEIQYLPAIFSFYGLAAAVSLISSYRYPELRKIAEQDLTVIVDAERELGKRWPAARGIRNALENKIASMRKPNTSADEPQLDVPEAEVEAYFSGFGPGLCRAREVVLNRNSITGIVDMNARNGINNRGLPFEYVQELRTTNDDQQATREPFQQIDESVPLPDLDGLDANMFGFQHEDMGYWLFDNSGAEFPLS